MPKREVDNTSSASLMSTCKTSLRRSNSGEEASFSSGPKKPGPKRRIRKIDTEEFDLAYLVEKEIKRLGKVGPISECEQKQISTRIRNRVSAQRSRTRQRDRLCSISQENDELRARIQSLEEKNKELLVAVQSAPSVRDSEELELRYENAVLREGLARKAADEKCLARKLSELEERMIVVERGRKLSIVRESRAGLSVSTSKTFVLFAGLLLLSIVFVGRANHPSPIPIGFDLGITEGADAAGSTPGAGFPLEAVAAVQTLAKRQAFEAIKWSYTDSRTKDLDTRPRTLTDFQVRRV